MNNTATLTIEQEDAIMRDKLIRFALDKIKKHITDDPRQDEQSRDLHNAISIIVNQFRQLGALQPGNGN
jgi:hypothetical protein